ncbi:mechanosensitive ion channel family protein [uncultured Methanoregula sp.]|uniref:mechanosensitive ion channel family protein n=1 Tax=uncultured Methanoregula sp. TaxID=1005933 RepID=UPI002AAB7439|nr:mechanosensitive ion channel family protein [uncultured Methanoregula sp.]
MILGDLINLTSTMSEVSENADAITSDFSWGDLVFVLLLFIAAYVIGLVVAHFMKLRFSHRMKDDQLALATTIVRVLIIFISLALALPGIFHLSMAIVFLLLLGCIIAIAMSSSAVVGNAAAGVGLLYEHTFSPGDFIQVGEVTGTVVAVHILSITIRTPSGVLVRIPNNMLYSTTLSNFHAHVARRYSYDAGIRYEDNAKMAIDIIRNIVESHTFVLKNPAPEIFVSDIDPCSIRIKCRFWVPSVWANTQDDLSLRTEFLLRIKEALEAAGIEIPFPQTTVHLTGPDREEAGKPR